VLDHDAVDLVRHVLERVGDALEVLVDFAVDNELQGVLGAVLLQRLLEPAAWIASAVGFRGAPAARSARAGGRRSCRGRAAAERLRVTRAASTMIAPMSFISWGMRLTS
jgi:hypothetical protein